MALMPPLKAIGRTMIEIYGPAPSAAKWGEALWGQANWSSNTWRDVTPQSMVVKVSWGADDPQGVLTVPAAGSWSITTYDPERKLDPSNGASPYAASLRPGRPIRVSCMEGGVKEVVRIGIIDAITFDVREKTGTLVGSDVVPLIVGAKLHEGQNDDPNLPDTLRARAAYLLAKVGLDKLVPVEAVSDKQLITNTSFEQGWTGWSNSGGGTGTGPVVSPAVDGAQVMALVGGTGYPKVIQSAPGLAIEGETYTVRGYCRVQSGAQLPSIGITGRNEGGSAVTAAFKAGTLLDGTWEYIEQTYVVPAGVTVVQADIRMNVSATVAGDVVQFDKVELWGPDPNVAVLTDPPVGPLPNDRDTSVWSLIGTSAFDALHAMWVDRDGTLRFRSFGAPVDEGFQVGGDEGIPISTIKTNGSTAGVYTSILAFDDGAPTVPVVKTDPASADIYGLITLTREKPVPDANVWTDSVLADRSGAGLQYETGTLYPRTFAELMAIVTLDMVDIMHIVADDIEPPLNIAARVLGAKLTADTDTGWTAEVVSYIPANEWEDAETPPPIEPPIDPPPVTHQETRYYDASQDGRAARDSGGTNLGSGQEELPVGAWQGWRNRSFIAFASIPWGGVVSVDNCQLELDTTDQVNIGFGSSPKITVQRVTAGWSEGSSTSPSGSNSLKYPGPAVTSADAKTVGITRSENAPVSIDITGIARAWRNGAGQYGVGLFSAGEDNTAYTTEFWHSEQSNTGRRPRLKLVVTVEG